ncbi:MULTISPECIES: hypothetical protein [Burkholderia]|nr:MULTISPECIES: hypothetical protein [Burkholderia]
MADDTGPLTSGLLFELRENGRHCLVIRHIVMATVLVWIGIRVRSTTT